jgi:GDPmannose 4,6-dehydratase
MVYGDITDQSNLDMIVSEYKPDEVYGLAAMSFVPVSWKSPAYTMEVNSIGPLKLLEAIRHHKPDAKFFFAGSSEQFGKVVEIPQTETTPFYPRSPYGVSKCAGFWITKSYRESYNLFACSGLAFNHESPRRGREFVTKKITDAVAAIKNNKQDKLYLGNLDSKRDWSFAGDIIRGIWLMLQQDTPDDYVFGSDETHSVREFCEEAFSVVGLDYKKYVEIDPQFFRPAEVDILIADSSKARKVLGWKPQHHFYDLVRIMVEDSLKEYYVNYETR